MKKILFATLLAGGCLSAQAQQLANANFDGTWETCSPWTGDQTNSIGTEPENWHVSNVAGTKIAILGWKGSTQVADQVTGRGGVGHAVKLYNAANSYKTSETVPGYLTLGTPWSTAKGTAGDNKDGGTWGGKEFSYKPDAIHFWYQRTASDGNADKPASVIAYLWKGTYKQDNVPCNIKVTSPTSITMENRDVNILKDSKGSQGGNITSKGTRIAQIETYITDVKTEWTEKTIEFTYDDKNSAPEMINIIFAASDYFNQSVAKGNTFTIDDVTLVYYSTLATLTFKNQDILSKPTTTSSDGKTITIDMSDTQYQAGQIAYTLKGVGASVLSANYDPQTNIYTIKVAGNDNANNSNVTTYNIQFMKIVTIINGEDINTTAGKAQVTMTRGFKQGWNTVCLPFATTAAKLGATKVQEFTAGDDKSVTFSEVTSGNIAANTPYLVYFPQAKSSAYTDVVDLEKSEPKRVTHGAFTFIGNYKSGLNMNGFYGVADIKGVQCLRRGGSTATLPAGCAYFVSTSGNANGLAINFDGQTTGINTIEATDAQTTGSVYNLQGIKVSANGTAGLPAGIYIQGGRKVIVK